MDDNEDDKKRVLTPPADWSEGLKPKSSDDYEEDIDEGTDWLEEDDFEVPPADDAGPDGDDNEDVEDDVEETTDSAALLTDHTATANDSGSGSKIPWALAIDW